MSSVHSISSQQIPRQRKEFSIVIIMGIEEEISAIRPSYRCNECLEVFVKHSNKLRQQVRITNAEYLAVKSFVPRVDVGEARRIEQTRKIEKYQAAALAQKEINTFDTHN